MSVAIMTDTNSGLTPEQAKELGVYLLPMPILIDGNAYYEHQSITPKEFYEKTGQGRYQHHPALPG